MLANVFGDPFSQGDILESHLLDLQRSRRNISIQVVPYWEYVLSNAKPCSYRLSVRQKAEMIVQLPHANIIMSPSSLKA